MIDDNHIDQIELDLYYKSGSLKSKVDLIKLRSPHTQINFVISCSCQVISSLIWSIVFRQLILYYKMMSVLQNYDNKNWYIMLPHLFFQIKNLEGNICWLNEIFESLQVLNISPTTIYTDITYYYHLYGRGSN